MLKKVEAHHFEILIAQTGSLYLPDGMILQVTIDRLKEIPAAKLHHDERMPFSVTLTSLEPTEFIDGLCAMELPGLGLVDDIFVSRVPAMGRDPQLGYFCISFN